MVFERVFFAFLGLLTPQSSASMTPCLPLGDAGQQLCGVEDLSAPGSRVVAPAADTASQGGHRFDDIADGPRHPGHIDLRIGGPSCEVRTDPNDDHPVATLRNTKRLGAHDEIRRLCRLLQAGLAILDPDGTKFVVMGMARAERGQILHQHLEDKSVRTAMQK